MRRHARSATVVRSSTMKNARLRSDGIALGGRQLARWLSLAFLLSACSTGPSMTAAPAAANQDATEVAALLCGHFASTVQSKADSEYFDVRLHMVRIWQPRSDAIWLYVEQAMESAPCKPYRQRIYRVAERSPGEVVSQVFELPDPGAFICAWSAPERFDGLQPEMLTEREGCRITLRRSNGVWSGSTDGQSCLSSLRGSTYATSEVRLARERIETWDRGFDSQEKQVWGARKGAYIFDRLSETPTNPCATPSVGASAGQ